ncbi:MAG: hypothetical protein PVI97_17545, partial [Candidatus Thiodiazotropha sp.]
ANPVSSDVTAAVEAKGCMRAQRDLTEAWKSRSYWCGNDKKRNFTMKPNMRNLSPSSSKSGAGIESAMRAVRVSKLRLQNLASTLKALQADMVYYHSVDDEQRQEVPEDNSRSAEANTTSENIEALDNERIHYAPNREVLGPKGKKKVISLMPAAKKARRISLLGLYEPKEIDALESGPQLEERFSVGRSLSVRELWRSEGIDVSKVTINHHKKNRLGRFVEVKFYD